MRLALLGIILKSAGLPEQCPQARFVMWLKSEGIYDTVKNKVIENGSEWEAELDNLYVAEDLHQALAEVKPNLFADAHSCAEALLNQYPNVQDVSNDDMVKVIRQALIKDGKFPLTLVVLDEVQQYIGEDGQKSHDVQEVVETCCKNIGSKLFFIGTGQTAVSGTSNLKKLEGRFTLRIELSDADVTAVVRKVILAKKPDVINDIKQVMQKNIGEISRHLSGTSIGHRQQEGELFSQDYPLLPVRRRFWECILRVLDQTGTDSQLRNQLSMVHRAAQTNLELELGNVIPADFLYFDLAGKLLQARILPRKVHEKTMVWRDQGEIEQLMARACGLVFLINRLTRNNQEIGIKATVDTLADLMVSDLAAGSSSLRSQLPEILEKCKLLMKVNDEYCIQTEESTAWHDEFDSQKNILANETHRLVADRDDRLKKKFSGVVGKLSLTQGQSKVSRDITSVFDAALPPAENKVQVWVRNGWNVEEDTVRIDAKQAGLQSPAIYVYIPKRSADDLRSHIIEYKASNTTLDKKGAPITPEGNEAHASMETRKSMAETKINELLAEALSGAKVFQAGGNEVLGLTLKDAVLEAAANSLQRLYPQFSTADHTNWGTVYNKAQQGAPDALSAVGYTNEPINHPVGKAIMGYIAAGKTGNDIRNQFEAAPYGWSRDAVDGALLVLMIAGQVRGVDEHIRTIEAKGLDRKQIAKLLFRVETVVVQIAQRLKVRKLYQTMGTHFEAGKETAKASDFLVAIQALADTAGGAPPQPARPDTTVVAEIQQKSGNEQLLGLAENYDILMEYITTWRDLTEKIVKRLPNWEKLQRLLRVEGVSVVAADLIVQVTAVADQRLLLEEPDSIAPILKLLEEILRNQLHAYQQAFLDSYQKGMVALSDDGSWQKMSAKKQEEILLKCNISEPIKIVTGTYEQLVAALQKYPLTSWTDRIAAMSGRFHKAIELAIKELEPEIQHCDIPRRTLKNTEDIDAWRAAQGGFRKRTGYHALMINEVGVFMEPLAKVLRNLLEIAVKKARCIAETAAKAALQQLGVEQAAPYSYLSEDARSLRRRLRAHGRQLGDVRDVGTEQQEIERLTEEVAYEHWHRMLFARFLAENGLLMFFDSEDSTDGVPVTLEDCKELAEELEYRNGWDLAARMATRMLPQIFRPHSPVFSLTLPPEREQELEKLLVDLPVEVFLASDSLGWVYQFWQAKKKEDINKSEVKIGARELSAVTQLFTEPYMVSFLLDNSLGAWWAARRLTTQDLQMAATEVELQQKASLPGVPLEYLRFVKDEAGTWTPASGTFEKWPEQLSEFKVLDPCCGSGHFLVAAYLMLVPLRMDLEGLTARQACDAVLQDNLHGLEIDKRCVELAAFALALTAWRYPGAGGYRKLADLRVACSGLAINAKKEEWLTLADGNSNLQWALEVIYDQFANAPVLGSLLNPEAGLDKDNLFTPEWAEVAPLLNKAFSGEDDAEKTEMGVAAYGMATAANILGGKYHWVITNVPYLSRSKQDDILRKFCDKNYPEAKNDLANVFLERCLEFCEHGTGTVSVVLPQNWLFLGRYKKFREKLLRNDMWQMIARLGVGAFGTISGEVVNVALLTISQGAIVNASHWLAGIDASEPRDTIEKTMLLRQGEIKQVVQVQQLKNPDARVTLEVVSDIALLNSYACCYQGISPADYPRFGRLYWEGNADGEWSYWHSTTQVTKHYSGSENILWMSAVRHKVVNEGTAYIRGKESWGRHGVLISAMSELPVSIGTGFPTDTNVAVIIPLNPAHLPAIWCFCSSPEYNEAVRQIDQALKVTNATLVKVPFDLEYWQKVATEKYPNGLPKPYSDDPTQWIFHGHPARSDAPLQVAVASLLGYRWPAELDDTMELSDEARVMLSQSAELLPFADEDGIVCIPAISGEAPAADRLLNLLAKAYEGQNVNEQVATLLTQADHAGRSLESWLRDKFFTQHCKLFHHRPFIWHIWDGLPDGFSALVNYHKLDRKTMETLIYTYLGDWIKRQKDGMTTQSDGAADRLAAAQTLEKSLELILKGENPYDIFVRWKSLDKQPLGWEPNLNDGVRMNIRPFLTAPDVSKRGAGIMRDKPNIKWEKDRGKDVVSAPWYQLGPEYGGNLGDRINDHHLKLAEKIQSRSQKQKEGV